MCSYEHDSRKYTLPEEGKSLSHLKTQVDYCLVRRNQRKFAKVLPSEECKPLLCDFKTRKVKDTMIKFVPRRKIWKLHKENVKSDFRS